MNTIEFQVILSVITVLGAGLSVFVGVKVALAELRKDISNLLADIATLEKRLERLEGPYFNRKGNE